MIPIFLTILSRVSRYHHCIRIVNAFSSLFLKFVSVVLKIVDENSMFEIMGDYAPNIVCAFARMEGRTVGIVANNPSTYFSYHGLSLQSCSTFDSFLIVILISSFGWMSR